MNVTPSGNVSMRGLAQTNIERLYFLLHQETKPVHIKDNKIIIESIFIDLSFSKPLLDSYKYFYIFIKTDNILCFKLFTS